MCTGPLERADEIGFEDSFNLIILLLVLFKEIFVREWFVRHRSCRCRCSCCSMSHRACQNVLPAKTHRRAATSNTKSREVPRTAGVLVPRTTARNLPARAARLGSCRACHLTYTWSGR